MKFPQTMRWGYAGVYPGDLMLWQGDPFANKLAFLRQYGFTSTHLDLAVWENPGQLAQLKAFLDIYPIEAVPGFHLDFESATEEEIQRQTESFLHLLERARRDIAIPMCMTGTRMHRFQRDPPLEAQLDKLELGLRGVAAACASLGCPLAIENHGNYYGEDLVRLCQRVPGLKILFDTGNCFLIGEQPLPACRAAAPYTMGIHCKDHCVHPDPQELKFVIEGAVLGEGDVGLRAIYEVLLHFAPAPEKLVLLWELVPPKNMPTPTAIARSWEFIRSLPAP